MAELKKAETLLQNIAEEVQNPKTAYVSGTTSLIMKRCAINKHNLDPSLVEQETQAELAIAEANIAHAQQKIANSLQQAPEQFASIAQRVAAFDTRNTADYKQTYGQKLPALKDSVQTLLSEKKRLHETVTEMDKFLITEIRKAHESAKANLGEASSKTKVKSELSQQLDKLLNSNEIDKRKKNVKTDTEKLELNETALTEKLTQIEKETISIAINAGIKVNIPAQSIELK